MSDMDRRQFFSVSAVPGAAAGLATAFGSRLARPTLATDRPERSFRFVQFGDTHFGAPATLRWSGLRGLLEAAIALRTRARSGLWRRGFVPGWNFPIPVRGLWPGGLSRGNTAREVPLGTGGADDLTGQSIAADSVKTEMSPSVVRQREASEAAGLVWTKLMSKRSRFAPS